MPDVGRFFNVDPLAEKYPYNGTYNFSENRVIDGRELEGLEWVDSKGNKVYDPSANNGKGGYTQYATTNDKNIGDGLRNSGDTGSRQFNTLVNSSHPITVNYDMDSTSKDKGGYQLGVTGNAIEGQKVNTKTNEVVDVIISESNITVNVGVISEFVSDVRSGKQQATEKGEKIVKNNPKLSAFDVAIATLGHEIDHTQSPNQTDKANGKDKEAVPTQKAEQILQDIANKKNNEKH